ALDTAFANLRDDPQLSQKVLAEANGEVKVNKRRSAVVILVIVLTLMFATIAVAVTLTLFEKYGQADPRLMEIAPQTMIAPAAVTIENAHMGQSTVSITNAYYDGSSLLFGYTIENPEHIGYFSPTKEQRAQMELGTSNFAFNESSEGEKMLEEEYKQARLKHSAFGLVRFKVFLSTDSYAGKETKLGTWTEFNAYSEQSLYSAIRDFDALPMDACNLERVSISTPIYQSQCFLYYDGKSTYSMELQIEMPPITVTIPLTPNEISRFEGDADDHGLAMHCVLEATDMRLSARVSVQGQLPALPDGYYYDMCLTDADGIFIEASSLESQKDDSLCFTFHGTGSEADLRTASLLIVGDERGTTAVVFDLAKIK
ncbi:MAG: hypothetical protein RSA65_08345, partial [Clostridia bacterium]